MPKKDESAMLLAAWISPATAPRRSASATPQASVAAAAASGAKVCVACGDTRNKLRACVGNY
jgi:hypothetical protein